MGDNEDDIDEHGPRPKDLTQSMRQMPMSISDSHSLGLPNPPQRQKGRNRRNRKPLLGFISTNSNSFNPADNELSEFNRTTTDINNTRRRNDSTTTWFSVSNVKTWFSKTNNRDNTLFSTVEEYPVNNNARIPIESANEVDSHYLGSIHLSDVDALLKPKPKRRMKVKEMGKMVVPCLLILFFVAIICLSAIIFSERNCSSVEGINIVGNEFEGCGSVEQDSLARIAIANAFSQSIEDTKITFENIIITCLPARALDNLSPFQVNLLQQRQNLAFNAVGLTKISSKAFSFALVGHITGLELTNNGIQEFPDDFFEPFQSLLDVDLGGNSFQSLEGNIFGDLTDFRSISFSGSPGLLEVPSCLSFIDRIDALNLSGCPSMVFANEGLLADVEIAAENIDLTNNRLLATSSETALFAVLGVEFNVTQV